jgi:hypothetical protein
MTKQNSRFGILTLSVLGAILLLALFAAGVTASSPISPVPNPDVASAAIVASTPITLPSPSWRIGITTDGLYRLSYETLNAAGVPTDEAPSAYHLLWRGQEMAMREVSDGDSTFESGEAFLFYAEKFHGSTQDEKYTDENVYWLYVDTGSPGLRMDTRSVASGGGAPLEWYTATIRAEENLTYWARWSTTPGTDATWFWDLLDTYQTPITHTYPVTLSAPSSVPHTATLTLAVAARVHDPLVNPDHHLRLTVNDTVAGEVTWDDQTGAVLSVTFASTALTPGVNQVHVTVLTDLSDDHEIFVDWIDIAFRREHVAEGDILAWETPLSGATGVTLTGFATDTIHLYDITQPLTPTHLVSATAFLSGTTYAVAMSDTAPAGTAYLAIAESAILDTPTPTIYYPPADLLAPTEGADEIIIAPAQFITALQPLSSLRQSQGLRVHIVDVNDIYAFFNGGVVHPEAIRSFISYAYDNWPGDPLSYLLLVGDGNFNPKGYNPQAYGEFVPTLIPPYLEFADITQGEVPVDSRYGDLDWDGMPEVAVGRIPANTVEQVEGVVAKIIAYESAPAADWKLRVFMVADDYDPGTGDFKATAEWLRNDYVPSLYDVPTVYLDDYGSAASATYALTQTWSQGAALLTYVGHGAVNQWAHEPLLINTQLASLTGTEGLPFVISLDCWDGYWMFPPKYPAFGNQDIHSTGEWATTVLTDRGAIAVFGAAGLSHPYVQEIMAPAMYEEMFENGTRRIGDITQAGRQAITWSYNGRTYTLLGDPATLLALDPLNETYIPLTLKK